MDYTAFLTPTIGATGILALVVVMILRGSLVPRRQVDAELKQKDDAIVLWKDAYERSEQQNQQKDRLITGLLETAQTTRSVLQALPEAVRLNEGGPHVSPAQE
jgi:hypothetical protein